MQISQYFLNGDIKGAIAYMRNHKEFKDIQPAYAAIFEDCEYRTYERAERKIWNVRNCMKKTGCPFDARYSSFCFLSLYALCLN